jgi:cytochrome c biogenesis protein CcdA/thiol-disulfide isomerase/thioredoxin
MVLLLGFAFLAGAGTALSPCVLPVLPAVLSASGAGGRRRPLGVVLGLTVTFTVTIVGIAEVVGGVGLGTDPLRVLAVVVLAGFGIALLFPGVAARLETPLARLSRYGPRTRGDGFASGLLVGAALGFVYTPCAGPILAAVITVSAATGRSVAVATAYAVGSAAVRLALCLGGRRVLDRVRAAGRGPLVQRVMGAVMLATALLIVTNLDVSFDQLVARKIPQVSVTASLERSDAVAGRLHEIDARKAKFTEPVPAGVQADAGGALPKLGMAPEFTDTERWFNTPGGRPQTLASLRRRGAVLVDFWTYTCINCLRTLSHLRAWDDRYRAAGLSIIGVHTPEFAFERREANVRDAIAANGLRYPVGLDNEYGTWKAWSNQYWPAKYLIDAHGQVRYWHFGEGDYDQTERAIRALLADAGRAPGADAAPVQAEQAAPGVTTPETYLGAARAQGFAVPIVPGTRDFGDRQVALHPDQFALRGHWTIEGERAVAGAGARNDAGLGGRRVLLVLGTPGRSGHERVLVDGRPIHDR